MQSENAQKCPQCKKSIEDSSKRIIRDTCGHEKCRLCLLQDDEGCLQCKTRTTLENTHTTVIKHSNTEKEHPSFKIIKKSKSGNVKSAKKCKRKLVKSTCNKDNLPDHITREDGEITTFKCNVCNSRFRTKNHVKYHEFCVNKEKPFVCEVCSKSFVLKSQLNIHELIHSNNKPHVCKICDKSFRESGKLKRHIILLHSDEKPHVCDQCGKSFKIITSLKQHRIIHSNEKPYSCKLCEMKFNNSSNLKKHFLSHSDHKSHMCERCGKKFKQKSALNVHKRIHLHLREFICEKCDKAFVNQKDLKRHQLIHLESKTYSCGLCLVSFRRKDNLGRHIKNAHPNKKAEIIENQNVKSSNETEKPVVDNPNAINVITVSPLVKNNENKPRMSMNGPLKLAFKTSAFKKNYNITSRDVNCDNEAKSEEMIFPSFYSTSNLSVEDFYANRPKVIENIKFKIPDNFPVRDEGLLKIVQQTYNNNNIENGEKCDDEFVGNLKNIHTSVIVNSNDQKNHWRPWNFRR